MKCKKSRRDTPPQTPPDKQVKHTFSKKTYVYYLDPDSIEEGEFTYQKVRQETE